MRAPRWPCLAWVYRLVVVRLVIIANPGDCGRPTPRLLLAWTRPVVEKLTWRPESTLDEVPHWGSRNCRLRAQNEGHARGRLRANCLEGAKSAAPPIAGGASWPGEEWN